MLVVKQKKERMARAHTGAFDVNPVSILRGLYFSRLGTIAFKHCKTFVSCSNQMACASALTGTLQYDHDVPACICFFARKHTPERLVTCLHGNCGSVLSWGEGSFLAGAKKVGHGCASTLCTQHVPCVCLLIFDITVGSYF